MLIERSRPPVRLSVDIASPDGRHTRWGPDERDPANVPTNLTFSSTMPGGFEQMSCTLARHPDFDYRDLAEFSTVTVYGAGGETAWQGRLETTPRTSGSQMAITPGAVGWQAALDDDQSAAMIFVDTDLSRWGGLPLEREKYVGPGGSGGFSFQVGSEGAVSSPGSTPTLELVVTGDWVSPNKPLSEAWYDSGYVGRIGKLYYNYTSPDGAYGGSWTNGVFATDTDTGTPYTTLASLSAPGSAYIAVGTRYAYIQEAYGLTDAGTQGYNYRQDWQLAVYGDHGLPLYSPASGAADPKGVHASDVVRYAVSRWAPELLLARAGESTIEGSTFVIPHLTFPDPTTVTDMISQATQYGLVDWWVDEGPTFNLATRDLHGRTWQARVGPTGLQETGPQVDHMYNATCVSYNDEAGAARVVTVTDYDPTNPVTLAGITRVYAYPNVGTLTAEAAAQIGSRFLLENRQQNTAGQATIVGHVQDSTGTWFPAWAIRAGDWITFTDAHDPQPRRIVRAAYSDVGRTCQLDLDSPPQDLAQVLARLVAGKGAIGIG